MAGMLLSNDSRRPCNRMQRAVLAKPLVSVLCVNTQRSFYQRIARVSMRMGGEPRLLWGTGMGSSFLRRQEPRVRAHRRATGRRRIAAPLCIPGSEQNDRGQGMRGSCLRRNDGHGGIVIPAKAGISFPVVSMGMRGSCLRRNDGHGGIVIPAKAGISFPVVSMGMRGSCLRRNDGGTHTGGARFLPPQERRGHPHRRGEVPAFAGTTGACGYRHSREGGNLVPRRLHGDARFLPSQERRAWGYRHSREGGNLVPRRLHGDARFLPSQERRRHPHRRGEVPASAGTTAMGVSSFPRRRESRSPSSPWGCEVPASAGTTRAPTPEGRGSCLRRNDEGGQRMRGSCLRRNDGP